MHVPFLFSFTPAAPDERHVFKPLDATENLIISDLSDRPSTGLTATKLPLESTKLWITGLTVTVDHGCVVSVGYEANPTGPVVDELYTVLATLGGNGGIACQFNLGVDIPYKPRIVVVAGEDADGGTVFRIAGHLEVFV